MSIDAGIRYRPPFGVASDAGVAALVNNGASATAVALAAHFIAGDAGLQALINNANSVSRATLDKLYLRDYNVKAYGAVGDGVTDDTAAIHAARDAAGAGGTLWFPKGNYLTNGLTATLTQQWDLAPGATILNAGTGHAVTVSASGFTIRGGKIDGGVGSAFSDVFVNAGLSDVTVIGVEIFHAANGVRVKGGTGAVATRITVTRCHIHDTSNHGVFYNWETTNSEVSFNQIHDTGGNGVWIGNNSNRARVLGNEIDNATGNGIELPIAAPDSIVAYNIINVANIGISLDRSDRTKVACNTIISTVLYGVECAAANFCVVLGNTISLTGSMGVSISAPTGTCNDNTIASNIILNPALNGIYAGGSANGAKRTTVCDNDIVDFTNGAGGGVGIGGVSGIGGDGWIISDNRIYMTLTASGTSINVHVPNTLVNGNKILYDAGIAAAAGTGIALTSAALDCMVVDNHITGNGKLTNGVTMNVACTGCGVMVNRISGTTGQIIQCNAANNTNTVGGNIGTAVSGGGYSLGSCNGFANRSTSVGANLQHAGAHQFLTGSTVGFFGAAPVAQQALAAAATDAATTQILANSIRTAMINLGLGA